MSHKYNPDLAIDLTTQNTSRPGFGWFGPFPSRPCDSCGSDYFHPTDWNLGYRCDNCGEKFGTEAEWQWAQGR